jgi:FixJ family two-component response regulator
MQPDDDAENLTMSARHIAIVEDDETVRTGLSDLLRSVGYRVSLFESADAFLAMATPTDFSGVVADVQMPGTTGFGLTRRLSASRLPVILMTARPDQTYEEEAAFSGAVALLLKPFDPIALFDHIERHFL